MAFSQVALFPEPDLRSMDALVAVSPTNLGQFFTPLEVADFMASLFLESTRAVKLLDAGAGLGILTQAAVKHLSKQSQLVDVTLYEKDVALREPLLQTLTLCQQIAQAAKAELRSELYLKDFLLTHLEQQIKPRFSHVILNPPYAKLARGTHLRKKLEDYGLDANNLYSAFLDLSIELLEDGGELVAITPRSFFNGVYFTSFRKRFLQRMQLSHIRIFESRREVFSGVLQETVIIHAIKSKARGAVTISHVALGKAGSTQRCVQYTEVVQPTDTELFIRVPENQKVAEQSSKVEALSHRLTSLGLQVSTGRVVDFRVPELLHHMPSTGDHALLYPKHLQAGTIVFPLQAAKANALSAAKASQAVLVPEGFYVLIKRFSAKEEARRVVAALYEPQKARFGAVGFENHLNYIHCKGHGLERKTALGLVVYLNSTAFDTAFRIFSGHTQVNATDLRNMMFPSIEVLHRLAARVSLPLPNQDVLDSIVTQEVFPCQT